ncbi:SNF2-related protein, partial [Myxococcota bacterium]|nr:SNF2-related protein [Myxococcota bacterium]
RLRTASAREPELPTTLRAELRAYQHDGFRWLARLAEWGLGACLADDMGLGKTVQAIALLTARASTGPALVVAPTSVGFNWARELERFAPGLRPLLLGELAPAERAGVITRLGPGDVMIAGYGLLVREADALASIELGTFVLDEAQAIKNSATERARAAQRIRAGFRLALTGTPVENHVGDLWSLFRVICPGLLGSAEHFRRRFAATRTDAAERRAALAQLVRPFVLRRTKQEVLSELPPKTEVQIDVVLSAEDRRRYEQARLATIAELTGVASVLPQQQRRFSVLAALTRLRQFACDARLVDPAETVGSAKLATAVSILRELAEEGHRALVFSQFTSLLALLRRELDAAGVTHLYLDGNTPAGDRAGLVDAFQAGTATAFLLSLKAGGTGLNLTSADYVLHLDPWWNPAVEDQATDRAHRMGQTRPVTVYRLVARGTIEEAILALHADKRRLFGDLLEGTSTAAALTTEELMTLIRSATDAPPSEPPALTPRATNDAARTTGDTQTADGARSPAVRALLGTGEAPRATNEAPDATNEALHATNEPPDATNEPRRAKNEPPRAKNEPPDATNEPLRAKNEPPRAKNEPPDATNEPPRGAIAEKSTRAPRPAKSTASARDDEPRRTVVDSGARRAAKDASARDDEPRGTVVDSGARRAAKDASARRSDVEPAPPTQTSSDAAATRGSDDGAPARLPWPLVDDPHQQAAAYADFLGTEVDAGRYSARTAATYLREVRRFAALVEADVGKRRARGERPSVDAMLGRYEAEAPKGSVVAGRSALRGFLAFVELAEAEAPTERDAAKRKGRRPAQ